MISFSAPYTSTQYEMLKNTTEKIDMVEMAKPILTIMKGGKEDTF